MEVIKCGLCKEEIEYAQRCRVYVKTDEPRPYQRISKRPHIGRYKLISTSKSTEHISFARRLKRLREIKKHSSSGSSSSSSPVSEASQKKQHPVNKKENTKESKNIEKNQPEDQLLESESFEETVVEESAEKPSETPEKVDTEEETKEPVEKPLETSKKVDTEEETEEPVEKPSETSEKVNTEEQTEESLEKPSETPKKKNTEEERVDRKFQPSKKSATAVVKKTEALEERNCGGRVLRKKTFRAQKSKSDLPKNNPTKGKMSRPQFQSSFEEYIKPSLSKNNSILSISKHSDMNSSDSELVKVVQATSTPKSMKNGPTPNLKNSDCETYYWLEMPKPKQTELRRLGYQFDNLVAEVKHMKLPNTEWKIKIMVHKQEMVSVSFTKKLVPEKIVTVNAKSLVCDITVDGKKIVLLGSPVFIHSIKDLEIMLDIVNDVEPNSPMITYQKTLP